MQRIVINHMWHLKSNRYGVRQFSQTIRLYENTKKEPISEILKKAVISSAESNPKSNRKISKTEFKKNQSLQQDEIKFLKSSKVKKFMDNKKTLTKIDTKPIDKKPQVLTVKQGMNIQELADITSREPKLLAELFTKLTGYSINYHKPIHSTHLIRNIVKACGFSVQFVQFKTIQEPENEKMHSSGGNLDLVPFPPDSPKDCIRRPPVVTIMGHVDHGKTTLLDSLRSSRIVDEEFGGITQHIGAFTVKLANSDLPVTFLDTPGHAAFAAMRERGANSTDIVILVVAADDGIMPQTVQSIRMAKEAGTPIIVAINKIDKSESNIENIKMLLSSHGLMVEDYGGDVQCVPLSALKRIHLDKLQEAILTQAEVMELSASHSIPVHGVVVEASTRHGIGKVATILVQRGLLEIGDILLAGTALCKVKLMENDLGERVTRVSPGYPATVTGWKELPNAGDIVLQAESLQHATMVLRNRIDKEKTEKAIEDHSAYSDRMSEYYKAYKAFIQQRNKDTRSRRSRIFASRRSDGFTNLIEQDDSVELPRYSLLVRADVDGSIEALIDLLSTYHTHDLCKLDIIDFGVGPPSITDVQKTKEAGGTIYLFNVEASAAIQKEAKEAGVDIHKHNVIYHFADDVKKCVEEKLKPIYEEEILGEAQVLKMFRITESNRKKIWVAGCRCISGNLSRNHLFKILRIQSPESIVQHSDNDLEDDEAKESVLAEALSCITLKHKTDDVEIIRRDVECGIRFDLSDLDDTEKNSPDQHKIIIQEGDRIICYKILERKRTLDWDLGF